MSGRPRTTIQSRLDKIKGDGPNSCYKGQIQTEGGVQWVTVIPEDLISEGFPIENSCITEAKVLTERGLRSHRFKK
jgi:hypothetical protein